MRATDLALAYPVVYRRTLVVEAARLLARMDLPGLVVVDDGDRPLTVLPATSVLRMAVPRYLIADPALARVIDEAAADIFMHELGDLEVAQALPEPLRDLPVVDGDATAVEIAALMVRARCPLVAVVGTDGRLVGVITLDGLLERVLAPQDEP